MLASIREYLRGTASQETNDLFQEVWIRLMEDRGRRLAGVDPSRPLTPWLVVVSVNHCRARLGRSRSGLPLAAASVLPSSEPTPVEAAVLAESCREAKEGLSELSPRDRLILKLSEVEGVPQEKIARILGVEPRSVSTLLGRARERLRRRMGAS